MELKVKVMDDDIGSDEKLGETKIELEKLGEFFAPMLSGCFVCLGRNPLVAGMSNIAKKRYRRRVP